MAGIGLTLGCAWVHLTAYSAAFSPYKPPDGSFFETNATSLAFYAGIILGGLLFALLSRQLSRTEDYFIYGSGFFMCFGTMVFGMAYRQTLFTHDIFAMIGCLFSGLGFVCFILSFCVTLSNKLSIQSSIGVYAVALALGLLLAFVLNIFLSRAGQIIAGTLIALIACIMLISISSQQGGGALSAIKLDKKESLYQLIALFIVCVGPLIIRSISYSGQWGIGRRDLGRSPETALITGVIACVLFLLVAWFCVVRRSQSPLRTRYQFLFFVLVAGCLILLFDRFTIPFTEISLRKIIVVSIERFAHLAIGFVAITSAQSKLSVFRTLGLAAVFYGATAIVAIVLFSKASNPTTIILTVAYSIALCATVIPLGIERKHETSLENVYKRIADEHGLTKRELEIFTYLAQGRSRPYIQKALHLAEGTIRTHSARIHEKLNVHSKQEMLDLVETYQKK